MGKNQTEKRGAFYKMEVAGRKLMFVALALVLVIATFPTEARKLYGADGKDDSSTPPKHLHYGLLPKGVPVPPSGPSKNRLPPLHLLIIALGLYSTVCTGVLFLHLRRMVLGTKN